LNIIPCTFNYNSKFKQIYDAPNFTTNIQFKLNLGWFKHVDIKILDSNKVGKIYRAFIESAPNNILFDSHNGTN
jgi:hypothetical protein